MWLLAVGLSRNNRRDTIDIRGLIIADDHGVYRAGLVSLLRDTLSLDHVVEVGDFPGVMEKLADETIALVILDLNMPGMEGATSLNRIKAQRSDVRIVVVSGSDDRNDVLAALSGGANGYVWKGSDNDEIVSALSAVMSGTIYVPTFMAEASPARNHEAEGGAPELDLSRFTPRQSEVLLLLAEGKSNKEIARDLDLAESTIKIHVTAILRELGARNRTQAVVLAQKLSAAT